MKTVISFTFALCGIFSYCFAQDYYTKLTLIQNYTQTGFYENQSVEFFNDEVITFGQGSVSFVSNSLYINKLNDDLSITNITSVPEHRYALQPSLVHDNQLLLCGVEGGGIWLRAYDTDLNLLTEQSYDLEGAFNPPFLGQIVAIDNQYALIGTINDGNTTFGLIFWINQSDWSLDEIQFYDWTMNNTEGSRTLFYEAKMNPNNEIAIFCHYAAPNAPLTQGIITINSAHEIVQLYPSNSPTVEVADMVILADGNYVFENKNPDLGQAINCFSSAGEALWQYDFPSTSNETFIVQELKVATNGDILGCGAYHYIGQPFAYYTGLIFRLSAEGELLWFREIWEYLPDSEELYTTDLTSIYEDENGDITWIGDAKPVSQSTIDFSHEKYHWVVKTDENGCFSSYYCDEVPPSSTTSTELETVYFELVQNPINTSLNIQLKTLPSADKQFIISNLAGQQLIIHPVDSREDMTFDVQSLPSGIYFLTLQLENGAVQTEKFIKID